MVDSSDHVLRINQGFTSLFGYAEDEAVGRPINELIVPQDLMEEGTRLSAESLAGEMVQSESVRRTKDGDMIHVYILGVPIMVDEAQVGVYGIYNDITARVLAENELKHQARHDFLTNLPNRSIFLERIKSALTRVARHENYNCAVLFLDLDKFKHINDTYGHKAGDELLVSLARRMQTCLRDIDTVARFGGDEFAVLIDDALDLRKTIQVIERIMEATARPFTLDGNEVLTGVSIGVVPDIRGYESAGQVLSDADIALYRAKQGGRGRYEIFDASMQDEATRMTQLESDLQAALEREEFSLYYQPIVHMPDGPEGGTVAGFEALLRWRHASQGVMMPTSFLGTAEETGLIQQIDYWVIGTAGRLIRDLRAAHPGRTLAMNVNLSPKNFYRADLVSQVKSVLDALDLGPRGLCLEIDENLLMEDPNFSAGGPGAVVQAGSGPGGGQFRRGHVLPDRTAPLPHTDDQAAPRVREDPDRTQGQPGDRPGAGHHGHHSGHRGGGQGRGDPGTARRPGGHGLPLCPGLSVPQAPAPRRDRSPAGRELSLFFRGPLC